MAENEKVYEISGEFLEKGNKKKFTKHVKAQNEKFAIEKTMALFGSKQKIKRRHITVNEAKEYKEEEAG
jgi:ribosomal protein L20A (L18A)